MIGCKDLRAAEQHGYFDILILYIAPAGAIVEQFCRFFSESAFCARRQQFQFEFIASTLGKSSHLAQGIILHSEQLIEQIEHFGRRIQIAERALILKGSGRQHIL